MITARTYQPREVIALGTLPPQEPELEQAVLGAMMIERDALGAALSILEPEHLYVDAHKAVFEAAKELSGSGKSVDIYTVTQWLRAHRRLEEVGGAYYISTLTNKVASGAHVEMHARLIQQAYMQRTCIALGHSLAGLDRSRDVFDVLDEVSEAMAKVSLITSDADPVSAAAVAKSMIDNTERPLYIRPDMGDLDAHFAMGPGSVTVIGARPAVGKTAFCLSLCNNIARQGHKSLFISLEMSKGQLVARQLATFSGVDSERITKNELSDNERERVAMAATMNGAVLDRVLIDDRSGLRPTQVFGIMDRAKKRQGVDVVVIDYLQLMDGDGDNGHERMAAISKACKQAAKASGMRLVEISQLKRRDGADTEPLISDLRESGQLEADGDMILLLGREKGSDSLKVKIEKNKFGPVGVVQLHYNLSTQVISAGGHAWHAPTPHPDNRIEKQDHGAPF